MHKYNYSLIIPHYNIPKLLERLLLSVPLRHDLQVIVVDDCSNREVDEYEQLKIKFPNVEYYSTGVNGGGGKARNIGLKYALGKYVFFADADDYFEPIIDKVLDDYKDEDYDIIFFKGSSKDTETQQTTFRTNHLNNYIDLYIKNKIQAENYLRYLFGEPWCKFIRRQLIINNFILFDEINIHNDTTFAYLIGNAANKIYVDNRCIYCVTTRENSTSVTISEDRILTRVEVFSRAEKFFKEKHIQVRNKEPYLQLIRLFVNRKFSLYRKCVRIIHAKGFSYYHILKLCVITLGSELRDKFFKHNHI